MQPTPLYLKELAKPASLLKVGSTGFDVTRVQGWLNLHGFGVKVDGDFGDATDMALHKFNSYYSGTVTDEIWSSLVRPLITANSCKPKSTDFGLAVVEIASAYLAQKAREAGGDNKGPWVRHVCRGFEVAWCQGFASTVWNQAALMIGGHVPFDLVIEGQWSLFVPTIVDSARHADSFVAGANLHEPVPDGSMFFLRGGSYGYSHVGIVVADHGDTVETIEGNTNDDGSANGYEVARRYRKKTALDFGWSRPVPAAEPVEPAAEEPVA